MNDAIVLVDLITQLRLQGYSRYDAIIEAGRHHHHRRPHPHGPRHRQAHRYLLRPLGRTFMGGMISVTTLTLAYTYFDDLREMWKQLPAIMFGKKEEANG